MKRLLPFKEMLLPRDKICKINQKDAYFAISLSVKTRKYLRFRWKGLLYKFCWICFRPSSGSLIFTKLLKSPSLSLKKAHCKNNNLPRRCYYIFIKGIVEGNEYTDIHILAIRVSDQYQEVLTTANIDFKIFWGDKRFYENDLKPSQRESPQSNESTQGNHRKGESNSHRNKAN